MIQFEDSPVNFLNYTNGYYRVDKKFYLKKFNALTESLRTNQEISWDFHAAAFKSSLENTNLNLNLLEHYKNRAQQLRDSYDYLILAYTGGSDSHNILTTFLKNNIQLDEVWGDFPQSLLEKGGYNLCDSTASTNMAVEWYTIVIPEFKKLSQLYPKIKIHLSDCWENRNIEDHEDTTSIMSMPGNYLLIQRFRYVQKYAANLSEKTGKKVGIIVGVDKPIPYIKDDSYGMVFADKATFFKSGYVNGVYVPIEYFYWSATYPDLPVAQARCLWNYLLLNKDDTLKRLAYYDMSGSIEILDRNKNFDVPIKKVCYPYWDFSRIQVNKSGVFYNDNYSRFLNKFSDEKSYQSFLSATKNVYKLPSYVFNDNDHAYSDIKWNYSFFKLGKLNW